MLHWLVGASVVAGSPPGGWNTCGGLPAALNATACPATATCCHQNWAPGDGKWGCIDQASWVAEGVPAAAGPAVCCSSNNYTACPAGYTCSDLGGGAMVRTNCVREGAANVTGRQVCKQGAPLPLSTSLPNVLVVGDSVSIGYTPLLTQYMALTASVQHSPWGGDGGVSGQRTLSACCFARSLVRECPLHLSCTPIVIAGRGGGLRRPVP